MPISRLLTVGFLAVVTVSLTASPASEQSAAPAAAQNPKLEQYKRDVGLEVDGMREDIARMNDQVFSFAELGFQEFETSKYLTDILRKNGFTIQENLAGIPTAFMASWGSGKPVIALGSDIDCIPQASQKPGVAYHEAMIDGAPGHGEGHNSGMPLQDCRGARGQENHGAAAPAGDDPALAGRRGGARRDQGLLRPRRRVQGRGRRAVRARERAT